MADTFTTAQLNDLFSQPATQDVGTGSFSATFSQQLADAANANLLSGMTPDQAIQNTDRSLVNQGQGVKVVYNPQTKRFEVPGSSAPAVDQLPAEPEQLTTDQLNAMFSGTPASVVNPSKQRAEAAMQQAQLDAQRVDLDMTPGAAIRHAAGTAWEDIKAATEMAGSSLANWKSNHETTPAVPVTMEQLKSAQLMGLLPKNIDLNNKQQVAAAVIAKDINGQGPLHFDTKLNAVTLGTTYKNERAPDSPEVQALRQRAMDALDASKSSADAVAAFLAYSPILTNAVNPHLPATKLADTMKMVTQARNIVASPDQYSKDQVKMANDIISYWKEHSKRGATDDLKDFFKSVAEHPAGTVKQFVMSMIAQPELLLAGNTGDLGLAAKAGEVATTASKAARLARIGNIEAAEGASDAAKAMASTAERRSSQYEKLAAKAGTAAARYNAASNLVRPAAGAIVGAALNEKLADIQQDITQGTHGNNAGAAVQGALMGGLPAMFHGPHRLSDIEREATPIKSLTLPETSSPTTPKSPEPSIESPSIAESEVPPLNDLQGSLASATKQGGQVTPETLKKLAGLSAAAGIGATAGGIYAKQNDQNTLTGMGLGAVSLMASFLGMDRFAGDLARPMSFGGREMGTWGGKRSLNWSLHDEAAANQLDREGVPAEKIYAAYGLMKNPDGAWMKVAPDNEMVMHKDVKLPEWGGDSGAVRGLPLDEVVSNSAIQRLYPELAKEIKVVRLPESERATALGFYDPTTKTVAVADINDPYVRYTIIHELQHAIQFHEGWPEGSSPEMFSRKMFAARDMLRTQDKILTSHIDTALAKGDYVSARVLRDKQAELQEDPLFHVSDERITQEANHLYMETWGEEQARAAELYSDFTPNMWEDTRRLGRIPAIGRDESEHLIIRGGRPASMREGTNIHPQEKELVERAKNGDGHAIAELYNWYKPQLTRALQRFMKKNGRPNIGPKLGLEADHIVNDAFRKVLDKLPEFRGDSSLYTYLYRAAINEAKNRITMAASRPDEVSIFRDAEESHSAPSDELKFGVGRRQHEDQLAPGAEDELPRTLSPEEQAMNESLGKQLQDVLRRMPKENRQAIIDHDIDGKTFNDMAAEYGITREAAFKRYQRGHVIARSMLGKKEGGAIDPEVFIKLFKYGVLPASGALLGYAIGPKEEKNHWAFYGALSGLLLGHMPLGDTLRDVRTLLGRPDHVNVNHLTGAYDAIIVGGDRQVAQIHAKIKTLVPQLKDRVALTHWLEGDHSIPLSANQKLAAREIQHFYNTLGKVGQSVGLFGDLLPDFVNHEWLTDKGDWTRHNVKRTHETYAEGIANGLTPRTLDIADLVSLYGRDTFRAIASKYLTGNLKKFSMGSDGMFAMMPADKAPYNYVTIDHPALRGQMVHPDLAPSLDFIYKAQYGDIGQAIAVFNTTMKRSKLGLSMFHPFTLALIHLTANPGTHALRSVVEIGKSAVGRSAMHKMYMEGGYGDAVDLLLRNGLTATARKGGEVVDQDMNNGLHQGLESLQGFLNTIPIFGKSAEMGVGLVDKIFKVQDKFIWENLHAGLKLQTAMHFFNRAKMNWMRTVRENPTTKMPSDDEIAASIAKTVNDMYGGLNWRRTVDEANTRAGRILAYTLNNPRSRFILQIGVFAYDWAASTVRTFVNALPQGLDVKQGMSGLVHPKLPQDFYRQYIFRNAVLYFTAYNALNQMLSGHPIWQNTDNYGDWDPFDIQLGNGETIQPNKHFFETPNMVMHTRKWLLGKMGQVPKEIISQLMNVEYLTATGDPPPMKTPRFLHFLENYMPISFDSWQDQGKWSSLLSLFMEVKHHATVDVKAKQRQAQRERRNRKHSASATALIGE
jgi:RNA polymerase sigma-70 factor (ECF subfamily)